MKKFGLFLFAAFAALGLASCNDNQGYDGPSLQSFVTVHRNWLGDYWFETDAHRTIYPGDRSRIETYKAEEGARALIYFSLLDTPAEGYDYNATVYAVASVASAQVEAIETKEELDALKDDPIVGASGQFVGDWINFIVRYVSTSNGQKGHKFRLVADQVSEPAQVKEGYLYLELRHDAGDDKSGGYYDSALSFNVSDIAGLLEGKEGVVIRFNDGLQEQKMEIKHVSAESQSL